MKTATPKLVTLKPMPGSQSSTFISEGTKSAPSRRLIKPALPREKARAIVIGALARVRELGELDNADLLYILSQYDIWRYAHDPNFRIDLVTSSMANSITDELCDLEKRIADTLQKISRNHEDPVAISPIITSDSASSDAP